MNQTETNTEEATPRRQNVFSEHEIDWQQPGQIHARRNELTAEIARRNRDEKRWMIAMAIIGAIALAKIIVETINFLP